ncbi:MAG TPA: haloalkane dehalogenase [Baekduia sp.]|uniref:haloalkane dehalogenase n=1 Tax=Baekduia sp. TaxID=2600305 RepID=UPI002D7A19D7|nr:haloalkane dehalogenase [Baekduia sp.]HET6508038.1 haloalkane dehalogenase [Baekduia sp.]
MEILRTPDERFADLPGWPYESRHAEVGDGLRMAYVDEGPRDGTPVLLLHGEPSWSYLYRSMIGPLADAGLRAIAPDLIGFGRSDKPAAREDYSYADHMRWLTALVVDVLDLRGAVLFGQDWGGLLGLRLAAEQEERFAAIVASNTFLPTGDRPLGEGFEQWRAFSQQVPEFPTGAIVNGGTTRDLTPAEIAAYDAPFPDESYKSGARQFPTLVPASPQDPAVPANRAAWEVLRRWEKPFVCAFGDRDPVTRGADRVLRELIPGAAGQPHVTLEGVGHFSQEDAGPRLAEIVIATAASA